MTDNVTHKPRVHTVRSMTGVTLSLSDALSGDEVTIARGLTWPMAHELRGAFEGLIGAAMTAQPKEDQ